MKRRYGVTIQRNSNTLFGFTIDMLWSPTLLVTLLGYTVVIGAYFEDQCSPVPESLDDPVAQQEVNDLWKLYQKD